MANPATILPEPEEEKLSSLFSRAIEDGKTILEREWALTRIEMQEELKEAAHASRQYVIGSMAIAFSIHLFSLVVAAFLYEVAHLPGWASIGIVALVQVAVAAVFIKHASKVFSKVKPIPTDSINDFTERVSWLMKSRA